MFAGLHKGKEALDKAKEDFGREAQLLREVGAEYLVHLPDQYTDMHGGALTESADIDPEQWQNLISGTNELARYLLEEYGVKLVFHPHADTHVDTQERVERFLSDTDPRAGQPVPGHRAHLLLRRRTTSRSSSGSRSGSPTCTSSRSSRRSASGCGRRSSRSPRPCRSGVMCEPPFGEPAFPPLLEALAKLDREIYTRHRAGPLPRRAAHPAADPGPRRRLHALLRAGPRPALALLTPLLELKGLPMTLNVGVIGVGMIGQDHIRRITHVVSGARVSAVTDVDLDRAKSVAADLPSAKALQTGQELIDDPEVDAIVVASWGPTHEEYVLASIAAGKQVFCEKPLATTREACERILDAEVAERQAARHGRVHAPLRRGLPGDEGRDRRRARSARR